MTLLEHVSSVKIALHRENPYTWHLSVLSNYILEIQYLSLINMSTKYTVLGTADFRLFQDFISD